MSEDGAVGSVKGLFYYQNFVSREEAEAISGEVRTLIGRHLLHGPKGPLVAAFTDFDTMPVWLQDVAQRLSDQKILPSVPFQISINEYSQADAFLLVSSFGLFTYSPE